MSIKIRKIYCTKIRNDQLLQATDEGRWRCNVGVVEAAEVKTASGMANLSLAVPPSAVLLEAPFDKEAVNVTAGWCSNRLFC